MSNKTLINKELLTGIADRLRYEFGISNNLSFPNDFSSNIIDPFYNYINNGFKDLTEYRNTKICGLKGRVFENNSSLVQVDLPNAEYIGERTFFSCTSLNNINLPKVKYIDEDGFYLCTELTSVTLPEVDFIDDKAFFHCSKLTSIDMPKVTRIGYYTFAGCKIETLRLPNVLFIDEWAFYDNTALESVEIPKVQVISDHAFYNNTSLKSIDLPEVREIGRGAFHNCSKLESVNAPNVIIIGSKYDSTSVFYHSCITKVEFPKAVKIYDGFSGCKQLVSVFLPEVDEIGEDIFSGCSALPSISLQKVTVIPRYAFNECHKLSYIDLPNAETLGDRAFYNCISLRKVHLPSVTTFGDYAFNGCTSLKALVLSSDTVCSAPKNAFDNTPIANKQGFIYVPSTLVESYKSSYTWKNFQIKAMEEAVLSEICGRSLLRNTAKQITIDYYCPVNDEFEPIITVTSSNDSVVSVSNVVVTDTDITFDISSHDVDGEATVTVTLTTGDQVLTQSANFKVIETALPCDYSVEAIDGAAYGFTLNDAGYYESQNKGVGNSYAVCKVNFFSNGIYTMKLNCINSGESNYDFGILSDVDTTLTLSNAEDSSNVFKSFKGLSSTEVQTVDYGFIPEGDHFIYIKFRKDGSSNSGNDSLQFVIEFAE
jgi:hypothetical protein